MTDSVWPQYSDEYQLQAIHQAAAYEWTLVGQEGSGRDKS